MRQVQNGKALGELVVDAALALGSGIVTSDFDAANGVANVEKSARLAAFAIDGERLTNGGLNAEAVEDGAEDVVVVEAVDECFILRRLVSHGAIDDALV